MGVSVEKGVPNEPISQVFETRKMRSGRVYRWVIAWLSLTALIAVLLLANTIRDYFFVARVIATQQIRHQMNQSAAALERELRRDPNSRAPSMNSLIELEVTRCGWSCAARTAT
jgi:hypothetical protein